MSTRCQIGFYKTKEKSLEDFNALIYRHSDGYPGTIDGEKCGVLPDIVPFLKWWKQVRGLSDTEYASARLLQYLCNKYDKHMTNIEKQHKEKPVYAGKLGHGVCKDFHGDIEYFYRVYPSVLEVYKIGNIWDKFDSKELKLIKTISL
jgi:hypothetical protein